MNTSHQNKTWSRGKKKLTASEAKQRKEWQKERVKITNLVSRKPEIDKSCVICGKPGHILHNKENPYCISFICDECSKDSNNIEVAKTKRIDIRTKLNKQNLNVSNFTRKELKDFVEKYLSVRNILPISKYCKELGISRHQFNEIIKKYEEITGKDNINVLIRNKTNTLRTGKLIEVNKPLQ